MNNYTDTTKLDDFDDFDKFLDEPTVNSPKMTVKKNRAEEIDKNKLTIKNISKLADFAGRLPKIPDKLIGLNDFQKDYKYIHKSSIRKEFSARKRAYFSTLMVAKTDYLYNNLNNNTLSEIFEVLCNIVTLNAPEENDQCYYLENLFGFVLAHLFVNKWLEDFVNKHKNNKNIDFSIVSDYINKMLSPELTSSKVIFDNKEYKLTDDSKFWNLFGVK
jgi:hypothetical protein